MSKRHRIACAAAVGFLVGSAAVAALLPDDDGLAAAVRWHVASFGEPDLHRTIVDNRGRGPGELGGLRNLRVVLPGILYRGGANNAYRRAGALPNQGPLPPEALPNLCAKGFSDAIYLYGRGFSPTSVECVSRGVPNRLRYTNAVPYSGKATTLAILRLVHEHIEGADHRPVLVHCWNGWHASGYVAAIALRQFCGMSGDQAVRYWDANAAPLGRSETADIHARIASFTPIADLRISEPHRRLLCGTTTTDTRGWAR